MNPLYKDNLALRLTPQELRNVKPIILVDTLEHTATYFKTVKDLLHFFRYKFCWCYSTC